MADARLEALVGRFAPEIAGRLVAKFAAPDAHGNLDFGTVEPRAISQMSIHMAESLAKEFMHWTRHEEHSQ